MRQLAGKLGDDESRAAPVTCWSCSLARPGALPPDEMDLDGLAAALARFEAFAVVVVTVGSAADPLLAGRYGRLCPPAPTQEPAHHPPAGAAGGRHGKPPPDAQVRLERTARRGGELAVAGRSRRRSG